MLGNKGKCSPRVAKHNGLSDVGLQVVEVGDEVELVLDILTLDVVFWYIELAVCIYVDGSV
eukprot:1378245-Amorphochlora_amoeboformis.AAC.1